MLTYDLIYRGTVVYNKDPEIKGKCKIFVHGVYPQEYFSLPDLLPWAEPAMPIMGGSWTNENGGLNKETGWCSPPHSGRSPETGAQVFVFFESGDINKPVYFAAAQSGPGWFSEHVNQHVFHSDNVRVRIDENPNDANSTCKFSTYNQQNSQTSIADGTKENVPTRIDIEVEATGLNAVNIQVHGDVNMHIDGDWYVEHIGDKHETHIGDHYIRHEGTTYIESVGDYTSTREGSIYDIIEGNQDTVIHANRNLTVMGNDNYTILGFATHDITMDYTFNAKNNAYYKILGDENKVIAGNSEILIQKDQTINYGNNCYTNVRNDYILTVTCECKILSKTGNIYIKTLGDFQVLNDNGNISADGYNNLGKKGNIILTSTLGNIGLETVPSDYVDFSIEDVCIPWNPSYLNKMQVLSNIGVTPENIVNAGAPPENFVEFLTWLTNPSNLLLDGFPSYMPCKMIMQNPNIKAPSGVSDGSWLKDFRSIDDDWKNVTNTAYWKLISKVIGNVSIDSWTGDISLRTQGQLGNAGNINLLANNMYGGLAGYETGNVKIMSNSPFRIYTDPRDLFFDSDLTSKMTGKMICFSTVSGDMTPKVAKYKPMEKAQALLELIGIPVQFGFTTDDSNGGGCMKCINDVFVQCAVDLGGFATIPWVIAKEVFSSDSIEMGHRFNAVSGSYIHKDDDIVQGSTSVIHQESNGFGHAVDVYGLDEFYGSGTYNIGTVCIESTGSLQANTGKNVTFTSKANRWIMSANTKLKTGYIYPIDEPDEILDTILGAMPVALPGKMVLAPVPDICVQTFMNQFDGKNITLYSDTFQNGDSGIYNALCIDQGVVGYTSSKYIISVPGFEFISDDSILKSSEDIDILDQYEIQPEFYFNKVVSVEPKVLSLDDFPIRSGYSIKFGSENDNIVSTAVAFTNYVDYEPFGKQFPQTAKNIMMIIPIVQILSEIIPGIGNNIYQVAKMLTNIKVPKTMYTNISIPYCVDLTSENKINAWTIIGTRFKGGIVPFSQGNPALFVETNASVPTISKEMDYKLSMGQFVTPPEAMVEKFITNLQGALDECQCNSTVGIGSPKVVQDNLGINEMFSYSQGLYLKRNIGMTVNILDSLYDKKAFLFKMGTTLPCIPDINWKINSTVYLLKSGVETQLEVPIINGSIKVDLLDETFALTVGGPVKPKCVLIIGNLEILDIPNGIAGILGNDLGTAILNLFE